MFEKVRVLEGWNPGSSVEQNGLARVWEKFEAGLGSSADASWNAALPL
jgi:hypothetical protein